MLESLTGLAAMGVNYNNIHYEELLINEILKCPHTKFSNVICSFKNYQTLLKLA